MNQALKNYRHSFGRWWLKKQMGQQPFTIFSNDCFGAEIYRWLNRPYNTPFVGLMLMAPCYLKLLKFPHKYLNTPLTFVEETRYVEMRSFRRKHHNYPIGMLDDVEIHFLHYASPQAAAEIWARRVQRIDWDHIKVKFAMDKDYATVELLQEFENLDYKCKLSVSNIEYKQSACNVRVPGFTLDAAYTFRQSLKVIDWQAWMSGEKNMVLKGPKKIGGILSSWSLKH